MREPIGTSNAEMTTQRVQPAASSEATLAEVKPGPGGEFVSIPLADNTPAKTKAETDKNVELSVEKKGDEMVMEKTANVPVEIALYTLNLVKNIVGTSVFSAPWAFARLGVVMSLVVLGVIGVMQAFTFCLLGRCAAKTGEKSYSGIFKNAYKDKPWVAQLVNVNVFFAVFVVLVLYLIIVGTNIPLVFKDWFDFVPNREATICIVSFGILLPISTLPNLSSIRHASFVGMAFMIFILIGGIIKFAEEGATSVNPAQAQPESIIAFLVAVPCLGGIYDAHNNAARFHFEYQPIEKKVGKKFTFEKVVGIVMVLVFFINTLFSLCAYFQFGQGIEQNVVESYGASFLTTTMKLGGAVSVMISFALFFNSVRAALHILAFKEKEMTLYYRLGWTFAIISVATLIAVFVKELGMFTAVTWALFGSNGAYILPCVAAWKLELLDTRVKKIGAVAVAGFGVIMAMIIGLITSSLVWANALSL